MYFQDEAVPGGSRGVDMKGSMLEHSEMRKK